ncbi:ECF RNA polymerase sigma factor SigK [Nocardia vulneris]|uniref:RNA polymerase sigma factor SigK n=1 Tax=Nocardia vulneris TaxID=1141657 RepID=A0ABR4ZAW2_9NOCA|nr:ECF RNA polymerase sigma factor SigK [Nocardia vulneris]KIA62237.1 RNA polymerase sigma factor SigK [Nocardia vulneris]
MPEDPKLTAIRLRRTGGDGGPSCPPRDNPEEAALTRRLLGLLDTVASGDRDAFTEFYRATSHRVFGLALRILRSHAAAEEITQEVYLQVWSLAAGYDRKLSSPMGWLMMLTHRRAVDRVRREQSAATRDIAYGQAHLGRDHDVVAEEVGQRFDEQSVLDCLDTLTEIQRQAVALAYYSGRTYSEVADHLAVPLPTIKSRIRDGLKRLENCLTGSDTR